MASPPIIPTVCSNITTVKILSPALVSDLKAVAQQWGFDRCEATPLIVPPRDQKAYQDWLTRGHHADMAYMARRPQERLMPAQHYPEFKTIITLGISYFQGDLPPKPGPAYGRVARYAWGRDYHDVIGERIQRLMSAWEPVLGGCQWMWATDSRPLLERALASSSGLGFQGKNTVLISPRNGQGFHVGSFLFLTEVLLDRPLAGDYNAPVVAAGCGACSRCLDVCPTGAFEGPYQLASGRCVSYLTIENKGSIPIAMREGVGDWLFGCDLCQDVCPFNARALESGWPEFQASSGVGAWVSLQEVLTLPDQTVFKKRFLGTPLLRSKRRGLIRNACVVAGNSNDKTLVPLLEALRFDNDEIIQEHALWALERLS